MVDLESNDQTFAGSFFSGNAEADSETFRGWFIGHFIPPLLGPRSTEDVEIKWGVHRRGEGQDQWTANKTATTISILVHGLDCISFPDGEVVLQNEGDYVVWGPGIPHRWQAIEDSVVITVRWPSAKDDSVEV